MFLFTGYSPVKSQQAAHTERKKSRKLGTKNLFPEVYILLNKTEMHADACAIGATTIILFSFMFLCPHSVTFSHFKQTTPDATDSFAGKEVSTALQRLH